MRSTALSLVVGRSIQMIELQDHERRIAALEQAREKRDEKDNPPAGLKFSKRKNALVNTPTVIVGNNRLPLLEGCTCVLSR